MFIVYRLTRTKKTIGKSFATEIDYRLVYTDQKESENFSDSL